ncbi:MAG: hypothetical protein H7832_10675 [Magnetococcus sp. DMHC-6]
MSAILDRIIQQLRVQLERTRFLNARLAGSITTTLGVNNPLFGLDGHRLAALEPFEQEILLSPLFTPGMEERVALESELPQEGVAPSQITEVIQQLQEGGVTCQVIFGQESRQLQVPEIVVERYVGLMYLDQNVPEKVAQLLSIFSLQGGERERAMVIARGRRCHYAYREELLIVSLEAMVRKHSFHLDKFEFLENFICSSRPHGVADLVPHLEGLIDSYREEEERPVFNEQLAKLQVQAITSEQCGDQVRGYRMTMAGQLLADFQA